MIIFKIKTFGYFVRLCASVTFQTDSLIYKSTFITHDQVDRLIKQGKLPLVKEILSRYSCWDNWIKSFSDLNIRPEILISLLHDKSMNECVDAKDLNETNKILMNIGIYLSDIIVKYPSIIFVSTGGIEGVLNLLRTYLSAKQVYSLVSKSPVVLSRDVTDMERSVTYAHEVMRLSKDTITSSKTFLYTSHHLIVRHRFLILCGSYPEDGKARSGLYQLPRLNDILVKSDAQFAKDVGFISYEEFKIFKDNFSLLGEFDDF